MNWLGLAAGILVITAAGMDWRANHASFAIACGVFITAIHAYHLIVGVYPFPMAR
jgi:hypothetical protein